MSRTVGQVMVSASVQVDASCVFFLVLITLFADWFCLAQNTSVKEHTFFR